MSPRVTGAAVDLFACDECGLVGQDEANVGAEGEEWGFCSTECMVRFVRDRWGEA